MSKKVVLTMYKAIFLKLKDNPFHIKILKESIRRNKKLENKQLISKNIQYMMDSLILINQVKKQLINKKIYEC